MSAASSASNGPLILGASGRVGRMFRHLAGAGLWPGPSPLFHSRTGDGQDYAWDMDGPAPRDDRLALAGGMIVLAGETAGTGDTNTRMARAALTLARREGIAPVLLSSSQAVYGRAPGPSAEGDAAHPATPYGHAKLAMERAVSGSGACCVRMANIAGADMLLTNAAAGPVTLDRFADGGGPRRRYVGPVTLARVLVALIAHRGALPPVLNVAAPGLLRMEDLLKAAKASHDWRPAPEGALAVLDLDTSMLGSLMEVPLATGVPTCLIAEAHLAGWRAAS